MESITGIVNLGRALHFILFFTLCLSGCGMCGITEVVQEIPSPDGIWKAVIFERNCGATTAFTTQVSVLRSDHQLPNRSGNVFVADTDHGASPAASWGGPYVSVEWLSKDKLRITRHPSTRVFKARNNFDKIQIIYESHTAQTQPSIQVVVPAPEALLLPFQKHPAQDLQPPK